MDHLDRTKLTFEQAEGAEALPRQLLPTEIPAPLRARLWQVLILHVEHDMERSGKVHSLGQIWGGIFHNFCVNRLGIFIDDMEASEPNFIKILKPRFLTGNYIELYGALQWLVRERDNAQFSDHIATVLEEERCAYRLVDMTLMPISSEEEGRTLQTALNDLETPGMQGARKHLLSAGSLLTDGKFADSIRESIHSVESVARALTNEASLSSALKKLSKSHPMHPALEKGFNTIYGFTSDASGIRHPIVGDGLPLEGEDEAIFMLGACAAFVSYLLRIGRQLP